MFLKSTATTAMRCARARFLLVGCKLNTSRDDDASSILQADDVGNEKTWLGHG